MWVSIVLKQGKVLIFLKASRKLFLCSMCVTQPSMVKNTLRSQTFARNKLFFGNLNVRLVPLPARSDIVRGSIKYFNDQAFPSRRAIALTLCVCLCLSQCASLAGDGLKRIGDRGYPCLAPIQLYKGICIAFCYFKYHLLHFQHI